MNKDKGRKKTEKKEEESRSTESRRKEIIKGDNSEDRSRKN